MAGAARFVHPLNPTAWRVLMSLLTLFGCVGVPVNVNQVRWQRHVAREMRSLVAVKPSPTPRTASAELPPPVARYRELSLGEARADSGDTLVIAA